MPIVLVSTDLMVASQLDGAARRAGDELVSASPKSAATVVAQRAPGVVVIDLSGVDDCAPLIVSLRSCLPAGARVIAFGPHVHTARLDAARAAGCDCVLTRGQFLARPEQYLCNAHAG